MTLLTNLALGNRSITIFLILLVLGPGCFHTRECVRTFTPNMITLS